MRPQGARRCSNRVRPAVDPVSIHAPRRGRDPLRSYFCGATSKFQSTRPQGARPARNFIARRATSFNPRARRGRDHSKFFSTITTFIRFQSTRPQGARRFAADHRSPGQCFNPRARRGRDGFSLRWYLIVIGFNPRARRGRDPLSGLEGILTKFQSTRPQGARPADRGHNE